MEAEAGANGGDGRNSTGQQRSLHMDRNPERPPSNMVQSLPERRPGMDDPGAVRARNEREAGAPNHQHGSTQHPPRIIERTKPKFTGKRRPKLSRLCPCGCNKKFKTTNPKQIYMNEAHKKRHYRKMSRHV